MRPASSERGGANASTAARVVDAVAPNSVDAVLAALGAAGVAPGRVAILTEDDTERLRAPLVRTGPAGVLRRFVHSLADDLDELVRVMEELADGRHIVVVSIGDETGRQLVDGVLRAYDGYLLALFGRWTIARES